MFDAGHYEDRGLCHVSCQVVCGATNMGLDRRGIWVVAAVGGFPASFVVVADDVFGRLIAYDQEFPALPVAAAGGLGRCLYELMDKFVGYRVGLEIADGSLGVERVEKADVVRAWVSPHMCLDKFTQCGYGGQWVGDRK